MTTFPQLLAARLAADPTRPFLTFYDDATGERTELSVTTYANWVAKTANLLVDELMLDPGDRIRLALPPHWLGPVFLGAAWSAGVEAPVEAGVDADALVTGPGTAQAGPTTLVCSLTPFAGRCTEPLPDGALDYGLLWPGQSDVFVPVEAVQLDPVTPSDDRILTDVDPLSSQGRSLLLAALAGRGSLVLVRNAREGQWPARSESERATSTLRSDQPIS